MEMLGLHVHGVGLNNPDFARFAQLCGANGYRVERAKELDHVFRASVSERRSHARRRRDLTSCAAYAPAARVGQSARARMRPCPDPGLGHGEAAKRLTSLAGALLSYLPSAGPQRRQ